MAVFDPNDWWSPQAWAGTPWLRKGDARRAAERNRAVVHRWTAIAAFCLCFASLAPQPDHVPAALSGLFALAALASVGLALATREHPASPHLTAWDEAALSLAVATALRFGAGATAG